MEAEAPATAPPAKNNSKIGVLLVNWDESFGPILVDARPSQFFTGDKNPQDLAVNSFMTAQSVFGGVTSTGFQKTKFLIPLHYVHLKGRLYFDFMEDEGTRGGRTPILLGIFAEIDVKDSFFDLFDPWAETFLQEYKSQGTADVRQILDKFAAYTSEEVIAQQSSFVLEKYSVEEAKEDLARAREAVLQMDLVTAQVAALKAGSRFLVEKMYQEAAESFFLAGKLRLNLHEFSTAREYFEIAAENFDAASQSGDGAAEFVDAARAQYFIGSCLMNTGQDAEALPFILKAQDYLAETSFSSTIDDALAELYLRLGDFEKSRAAFREAIHKYEEQDNAGLLAELACDFADLLVEQFLLPHLEEVVQQGREAPLIEEIITMYKLSAHKWNELSVPYDEGVVYEKLARALDKAGFLLESNEYYERTCTIFRRLGDYSRAVNNLINVGNNLGQLGDLEGAFEVYLQAFTESQQSKDVSLLEMQVMDPIFYQSPEGDAGNSIISQDGEVDLLIEEDLFTVVSKNAELTKKVIPLLRSMAETSAGMHHYIEAAKIYERTYELSHFIGELQWAREYKALTMENYLATMHQHHEFARLLLHLEHQYDLGQKYALLALQWAMLSLLFAEKTRHAEILDTVKDQLLFAKTTLQSSPRFKTTKSTRSRFRRLYTIYQKVSANLEGLDSFWDEVYDELTLRKTTFQISGK